MQVSNFNPIFDTPVMWSYYSDFVLLLYLYIDIFYQLLFYYVLTFDV